MLVSSDLQYTMNLQNAFIRLLKQTKREEKETKIKTRIKTKRLSREIVMYWRR